MSKNKKIREAQKKIERARENQFKSRGGRASVAFKNKKAYSRKRKHAGRGDE